MAKGTIRGIHAILSGAFEAAMRWEWTDRNPAALARPPTPRRQTILATSPEDVAKVIAEAAQEPDGRLSPDHQVARADELLGQAAAAAGRIAAERAERQARAEYIARADREAQAQREPTVETQAQYDVEMEL